MEEEVRILFLAAGTDDQSRRRLEQEAREIVERLRAGPEWDAFKLITEWAVRAGDLQRHLLDHRPHVVHIGGRGTEAGDILLADDGESQRPVSGRALAELFRILKDNIRVVVLNLPNAGGLVGELTTIIDYVVSTGDLSARQSAVTFAAHFYQALVYRRSVAEAFELAKNQLMLDGDPDYGKPVLFVGSPAAASHPLRSAGEHRPAAATHMTDAAPT